jgi:hypothetical protein
MTVMTGLGMTALRCPWRGTRRPNCPHQLPRSAVREAGMMAGSVRARAPCLLPACCVRCFHVHSWRGQSFTAALELASSPRDSLCGAVTSPFCEQNALIQLLSAITNALRRQKKNQGLDTQYWVSFRFSCLPGAYTPQALRIAVSPPTMRRRSST